MDFFGCCMFQGGVDLFIYFDGIVENVYICGMEVEDGVGFNIKFGLIVIEVFCGFEKGM